MVPEQIKRAYYKRVDGVAIDPATLPESEFVDGCKAVADDTSVTTDAEAEQLLLPEGVEDAPEDA